MDARLAYATSALASLAKAFDPDQPRDERGRWTHGAVSEEEMRAVSKQIAANLKALSDKGEVRVREARYDNLLGINIDYDLDPLGPGGSKVFARVLIMPDHLYVDGLDVYKPQTHTGWGTKVMDATLAGLDGSRLNRVHLYDASPRRNGETWWTHYAAKRPKYDWDITGDGSFQSEQGKAFNPDQPRDERGRWTDGGDASGTEMRDPREIPKPSHYIRAYKIFDLRDGKLYPTQTVDPDMPDKPTPVGVWLRAEKLVGKKSKLKPRIGWHGSELPISPQQRSTITGKMAPTRVWAKVRLANDPEVTRALKAEAALSPRREIVDKIPGPGFYEHFETNKFGRQKWLISGGIYVERILQDDEVSAILTKKGRHKDAVAEQRGARAELKYSPDQPRDPAGTPVSGPHGGGRFTSAAAGGSAGLFTQIDVDKIREVYSGSTVAQRASTTTNRDRINAVGSLLNNPDLPRMSVGDIGSVSETLAATINNPADQSTAVEILSQTIDKNPHLFDTKEGTRAVIASVLGMREYHGPALDKIAEIIDTKFPKDVVEHNAVDLSEFGLYSTDYKKFEQTFISQWSQYGGSSAHHRAYAALDPDKKFWRDNDTTPTEDIPSPQLKENLDRMYSDTQAFLAEEYKGFSVVNLYRGVGKKLRSYTPAPVESWTDLPNIADYFGVNFSEDGNHAILNQQIPIKDVLFTWESLGERWPEDRVAGKHEWAVMGRAISKGKLKIVNRKSNDGVDVILPADPDFERLLKAGEIVSGAGINSQWSSWNGESLKYSDDQPRDDHGRWTDGARLTAVGEMLTREGATRDEARKFVKDKAKEWGVDPDQVDIIDAKDAQMFTLDGQRLRSGGSFNTVTGMVTITYEPFAWEKDDALVGLAHEVEHLKYDHAATLIRMMENKQEGTVARLREMFPLEEMRAAGGITDYSKQYWKSEEFKDEVHVFDWARDRTINETLAEVNATKIAKTLPFAPLGYRASSAKEIPVIWDDLHSFVDAVYRDGKKAIVEWRRPQRKYSEDQPRDYHGRWTSGGDATGTEAPFNFRETFSEENAGKLRVKGDGNPAHEPPKYTILRSQENAKKAVDYARALGYVAVTFDGAPTDSVAGISAADKESILINSGARFWDDPAGDAEYSFLQGFNASPDPNALIHHEIAHVIYNDVPDNWESYDHSSLARRVSAYGAERPSDFVAEYYAGEKSGRTYDEKVTELFKHYAKSKARPPKPPPLSTEDFVNALLGKKSVDFASLLLHADMPYLQKPEAKYSPDQPRAPGGAPDGEGGQWVAVAPPPGGGAISDDDDDGYEEPKTRQKDIEEIARELDYDPGQIKILAKPKYFTLEGAREEYGGMAYVQGDRAGLIEVADNLDAEELRDILAHEIAHQKYERVHDALRKEEIAFGYERASNFGRNMTAEMAAKYPLAARFHKHDEEALKGVRGISNYADRWGKNLDKRPHDLGAQAQYFRESVAEIAVIGPKNVPEPWRAYYEDVLKTWDEIKPKRKYSPDQPRDYHGRWTDGGFGASDATGTPVAGPKKKKIALTKEERNITALDIVDDKTPPLPKNTRTNDEIADELEERSRAALKAAGVKGGELKVGEFKRGKGFVSANTPEEDEMLSRMMAAEVQDAIERSGVKNSRDWYSAKVDEAIGVAASEHPELLTDPNARSMFTIAMAITSNGEKVNANARLTELAYSYFKKHGRFPTDIPVKRLDPINGNFEKINGLLDKYKVAGTREFLSTKFRAGDLAKDYPSVDNAFSVDATVYGSAIIGAKTGQGFYQNLNGNYDPPTIDTWFMRGFGRLTGKMHDTNPELRLKQKNRLIEALKAAKKPVPRTSAGLHRVADEIGKAHEKDFKVNRALYDSGKKEKSELVYAAERYEHGRKGLIAEPKSKAHREWIVQRINRSVAILKEHGITITPADFQASWWYPEKRLFDKLGGRDADGNSVDFATAFRELYRKKRAARATP